MLKHNKSYLGTVAHKEIKTIPTNKSSSQVINLHHSHQPGSHFVAYVNKIDSPYIYYFDSYGAPISNLIKKKLRETGKKIIFNTNTIQNKKSNRCGGYCYMFIEAMTKGMPFLDFIILFKNNGSLNNDNILLRHIM